MSQTKSPPLISSLFTDIVMALRLYSRLPTGTGMHAPPNLDRIAHVLPFASVVIGAIPAGMLWGLAAIGCPPLLAALMATAAFAIVTGAMSEDGMADAADGLFGGQTRERRLEILKDSRHGTYGVLALVFVVGLKAAALAAIAARDPLAAAGVWMGAMLIARSGSLYLPLRLAPARTDGASAAAGRVSRTAFAIGAILALAAALALSAPFTGIWGIGLALPGVACVALGWTWICARLVGGQTGDLIGALQTLLEITTLVMFVLVFA